MKKYLMLLTSVLICTMMLPVLTSCISEDNPVTTPDSDPDGSPLADVTIMYYGHGGGNLDLWESSGLRDMYMADASCFKNVKIAVEYKFSAQDKLPEAADESEKKEMEELVKSKGREGELLISYKNYLKWMAPEGNSTFRFVVDPTKSLKEQAEGHYLPGKNAEITHPDSLTNFINWAAKACPAKKYVLVLVDHGRGYAPDADIFNPNAASTRGVIFDDGNNGNHFSAPSLAHAIKAANIRPEVVYFDACMMNTLEYMFELKDVTDYIVASTFITLSGTQYSQLINHLSKAPDNMKLAFEKFIETRVKYFESINETGLSQDDVFYFDMTVTETAKLDRLGKAMREFTDRLCNTYKNGTVEQKQKIDEVTKNAVRISDLGSLYDVGRYMESMTEALPDVFDEAFGEELEESFNDCIAAQYYSKYLSSRDYQVDYSVLLATKGTYFETKWKDDDDSDSKSHILSNLTSYEPDGKYTEYTVENGEFKNGVTPDYTLKAVKEGQWGGTLESVYGALAFDKATGWSRWLLLNEQQLPLWCNNEFQTPLPIISEE